MFKENDNMRPGPTPERVLAVCRLISQGSYTNQEIFKKSALDENADLSDEAIRSSIDSAEELGFINKSKDKYELIIEDRHLESAQSFRRLVSSVAFKNKKTTFFRLTEWFIKNSDEVLKINRFEDLAATAAKTGVSSVTENDILGWRFWMRYLGFAYQYNKTLIPNMKTRIEDALSGLPKNTKMTCTQFVSWIKENIPEAASACSEASLPLAVSNGLRVLSNEGTIELISTRDAVRTSLYPLNGVELNDFSEIIVRGCN
ncbi:MAG: hypothetical protein HFG78_06120 [Hungatella sp.]|nr:hypothetical protein [Hungatella sp.]